MTAKTTLAGTGRRSSGANWRSTTDRPNRKESQDNQPCCHQYRKTKIPSDAKVTQSVQDSSARWLSSSCADRRSGRRRRAECPPRGGHCRLAGGRAGDALPAPLRGRAAPRSLTRPPVRLEGQRRGKGSGGGRRVGGRPGSGLPEAPVLGVQAGRPGCRVVPRLPSRAPSLRRRRLVQHPLGQVGMHQLASPLTHAEQDVIASGQIRITPASASRVPDC